MKKYIAIFGLALSFMIASNTNAQENKLKVENVEVKETIYDMNAHAAKVGDTYITVGDVKNVYDSVPQLHVVPFDVVYPKLVEEMVNAKVISVAAKASNIAQKEEVKKIIAEQTDNIISSFYLSDRVEAKKSEEALKKLYNKIFAVKDEVRVRHIVVKTENEAKEAQKKLKKGADFAKLADEISLDTSSEGGDIGYFTEDAFGKDYAEFVKAAFNTKKGNIAKKIAKTPLGYHIIKVEDKRKTTPPPYENPEVKAKVEAEFVGQARDEVVAELTKKAKVKIYSLSGEEVIDVKKETVKEVKKAPKKKEVKKKAPPKKEVKKEPASETEAPKADKAEKKAEEAAKTEEKAKSEEEKAKTEEEKED